jgi:hypothetical protein
MDKNTFMYAAVIKLTKYPEAHTGSLIDKHPKQFVKFLTSIGFD